LFSLKDRFYGESGFYNSLYQSNLKVDSAKIENGIATIKLSGNLMLGGVMDNPRVKAQITETALQFSTIKEVRIFINDKTIDEALSLK
jgi:spore germination protein GerM